MRPQYVVAFLWEENMPGACCSKRKHTPIVSKKQRGLFGSELARRRSGKGSRMKGITTAELINHLKESKGKKLPARIKKKGKRRSSTLKIAIKYAGIKKRS